MRFTDNPKRNLSIIIDEFLPDLDFIDFQNDNNKNYMKNEIYDQIRDIFSEGLKKGLHKYLNDQKYKNIRNIQDLDNNDIDKFIPDIIHASRFENSGGLGVYNKIISVIEKHVPHILLHMLVNTEDSYQINGWIATVQEPKWNNQYTYDMSKIDYLLYLAKQQNMIKKQQHLIHNLQDSVQNIQSHHQHQIQLIQNEVNQLREKHNKRNKRIFKRFLRFWKSLF